ncbi:MAG: SigB/SigF/SigG family RNA polymerase sigma factor [Acidimicrobiia bacterium]|nr:SigB/SigF/SigG family RNA polymerase sigma factor [Acidimicrobiia bacterium]
MAGRLDDESPADEQAILERFSRYRRSGDRALRNELIEHHRGLALHLAQRFAHRGEPFDDLVQVAMLGLLKAVERFDPDRGAAFSSFAAPTISGELKRHFRDRTWSVKVPRRIQEMRLEVRAAADALHQRLGRAPAPAELAADLSVTTDEVLEAMEATNAYRATSLSAPLRDEPDVALEQRLGTDPTGELDRDVLLEQLIDELPEREQRLIRLRFFGDLTQSEIAEQLGISQMHVSRLLRRTLLDLRERLGDALG